MELLATRDFKRRRVKVLAAYRDPAQFEAVLRGMGATVARTAEAPEPRWDCQLMWRDEPRAFTAALTETAADETMVLVLGSDVVGGTLTIDFYDLPDGGCRTMAKAELAPRTLIGKMAVQSLRLMRGKAEDRLSRFLQAMGRPRPE